MALAELAKLNPEPPFMVQKSYTHDQMIRDLQDWYRTVYLILKEIETVLDDHETRIADLE